MTSDAIMAAVQRSPGQRPAVGCAHDAGCHDGAEPAVGTAPETARSWLLIEHDGPWPAEAADAALPGALAELAASAGESGVRVQLIRRPGRRRSRTAAAPGGPAEPLAVFAGWAAGSSPWLRRGDSTSVGGLFAQLADLAEGTVPSFGAPAKAPLYLVCTHGRRDACCARLGAPLARALAAAHPAEVWESTHVGGHRYAANLVILPHGLYYGPVDEVSATAAIGAYQRGEIAPARYRGRAGQRQGEQAAQYRRMVEAGSFGLSELE